MPKRTKENEELKNIAKNKSEKLTKSKTSTTKKSTSKKSTTTSSTSNKTSKTLKTNKSTVKPEKSSSTQNKKIKKETNKKRKSQNTVIEYYDLPQNYNKTVVKVLAQTPKTLFIYWEISDDDIESYKKQYGENFFETTKPVLIIHNDTLNYSFEVEINDFANSWYLHVNDSKSDYRIELGRRLIVKSDNIKQDYIYISSSNKIEAPNDHILFNNSQKMVYFRNVKTNQKIEKTVSTISFMKNMGKVYDIYDLYKELYKNEDSFEFLLNPSSHTLSQFK